MRRYTTPSQELFIPGVALESCTIYVTFADKDGNVILTVNNATANDSDSGSTVTVNLTQEQTAQFKAGEMLCIQVNWKDGSGKRYATEIAKVRCEDNLLEVAPTFEDQSLQTAFKYMSRNVQVDAIYVSTTTNPQGGNTVYIGGEFINA